MSKKLKGLPYPDNQHLDAAEGWLELGNWAEANEELELITPQWRAHPYVLEMRFHIYSKAGRPEMTAKVARGISAMFPDSGELFPALARIHESNRARMFIKRLKTVIITGVSLHSYLYVWAERVTAIGYHG